MEAIYILAISLFIVSTFLVYKLSIVKYREEYSEREWKLRGGRLYYWQGAVYISGFITVLIMLLLKALNLLPV